jgi:hypothetical protein
MNKFSRELGMSSHAHSRYIHFGTGNKNNLGNCKEARKSHRVSKSMTTIELI